MPGTVVVDGTIQLRYKLFNAKYCTVDFRYIEVKL